MEILCAPPNGTETTPDNMTNTIVRFPLLGGSFAGQVKIITNFNRTVSYYGYFIDISKNQRIPRIINLLESIPTFHDAHELVKHFVGSMNRAYTARSYILIDRLPESGRSATGLTCGEEAPCPLDSRVRRTGWQVR